MRTPAVLFAPAALLVAAGCATLVGDFTLGAGSSSSASSAGSSVSASSSSSGSGLGTGGASSTIASTTSTSSGLPVASCTPTDAGAAEPTDACGGVFVSSSLAADGGLQNGTRENPFATISQAVTALPGDGLIYVCGESFNEAVTATNTGTLTIYGGMQCHNGWTFPASDSMRTSLTSPAMPQATIPLNVSGAVAVSNFNISAPTPLNPGESSIAMVFGGDTLTLENITLSAQPGVNGADAAEWDAGAQFGTTGGTPSDPDCDNNGFQPGGAGSMNSCNGVFIVGGMGGVGGPGGPGSNGTMGTVNGTPAGGIGGDGGSSVPGSCTNGGAGDAGDPGAPTPAPIGLGTIGANGYLGPSVAADAGFSGGYGFPGGGGGGAYGACGSAPLAGSGGGAGGCGGNPGFPGNPGGSSIGLVLLSTSVVLNATNVRISTAAGGAGGVGGPGQPGGLASLGGQPPSDDSNPGCAGGNGGHGGNGGPGPGGAGGHSVGIAVSGTTAPNTKGISFSTLPPGAPGGYGAGVDAGSGAFDGPPGQSCQVLGFGLVLDAGAFDGGNLCLL